MKGKFARGGGFRRSVYIGIAVVVVILIIGLPFHRRQDAVSDDELVRRGINQVLQGSWKSIDLDPYTNLARSILPNENVLREGQSSDVYESRQVYVALAKLPFVRHICEIGFNAGASASLWLLANPDAKVTMFDAWRYPYADAAEAFLRNASTATAFQLRDVNERLQIVRGYSNITLRQFASQNYNAKCDLMVIDGGHSHETAMLDIKYMLSLANPQHHVLVVDDSNCDAFYCVDAAVAEHQRRGTLRALGGISEHLVLMNRHFQRGLTLHQYNIVPEAWRSSIEYFNLLNGKWAVLRGQGPMEQALRRDFPDSFLWKHYDSVRLIRALPLLPGVGRICVVSDDPAAAFLWASLSGTRDVVWFTRRSEDDAVAALQTASKLKLKMVVAGENLRVNLRRFATVHPETTCDVGALHGIQDVDEAVNLITDLRNIMVASARGGFIVVDETNCEISSCVDAAVEEHLRRRTGQTILQLSSVFDAADQRFFGGITVLHVDRGSH